MAIDHADAIAIYDDARREAGCLEYIRVGIDLFEEEAEPQMLAALLVAEVVFLNSHWWEKEWSEQARKTIALCVNCSDLFAWGCADAEGADYYEIPDLYAHWRKDDVRGTSIWCIKKRRRMPQAPVDKLIRAAGIWDLDEIGTSFAAICSDVVSDG